MRIYLVRHGESLPITSNPTQSLSERGIKETEAVAAWLQQAPLEIDEILHSVKPRAKQTAQILRRALAPEVSLIEKEGLKPNDSIEPLLEEIVTAERTLMIVSHLPFLEKLLTTLLFKRECASPVLLTCSCVICLEKEGETWSIAWVVSPQLCFNKCSRVPLVDSKLV